MDCLTFAVVWWLLFLSILLYWKLREVKDQLAEHRAKLDDMQAQMGTIMAHHIMAHRQGARFDPQGRAVPVEGGRALLMRLIDEHDSRRPGSNGNV